MIFPIFRELSVYFSSLIVILASILTFLGFNYTAERHRQAAKRYGGIMRMLETQMPFEHADAIILKQIEDQIDKINIEAPEIPLRIFNRENIKMKEDLAKISQKIVSGVTFHFSPFIPEDFTQEHFKLESLYFGKHLGCPATFQEFKEKYHSKSLTICEALLDRKLVGYCFFERVSDELHHLYIVVVIEPLRCHGIGTKLISTSCEHLASLGVKYVSLFTAEETIINKIFRGSAELVGDGSELNSQELKALREIEDYRGDTSGKYGNQRIVKKYYTLRDGSILDATFRLYKI